MRDQLLGYLLKALDDDEHEAVARRIADDPAARRELEVLRRGVAPLAADAVDEEPPAGLAARTCDFVFAGGQSRRIPAVGRAAPFRATAAEHRSPSAAAAGAFRRNWRAIDTFVALGAIAAAALFFFPALVQSRFVAQLDGCQNNLSKLHGPLVNYANSGIEAGFFPTIPQRGNEAVAGIYAVKLRDRGYLEDTRTLVCPSVLTKADKPLAVPTGAQLRAATGSQLAEYQRTMGGSYGYALGFVVARGNRLYYQAARPAHPNVNRASRWYPILSDAYDPHDGRPNSCNHGGSGQNVLFADGRVGYLSTARVEDQIDDQHVADDNIFRNNDDEVAAGIGPHDAVLGGSAASPWKR